MDSAYFPKEFSGIHDRYFSKSEILLITGNDAIASGIHCRLILQSIFKINRVEHHVSLNLFFCILYDSKCLAYPLYHGYYDIFRHFPDYIGKISYGKI